MDVYEAGDLVVAPSTHGWCCGMIIQKPLNESRMSDSALWHLVMVIEGTFWYPQDALKATT